MSLDFLYNPIAWVMKTWHALLSTFLDPDSGAAWAFSIVLLVVTVRILLFPLFVKQIKSQRAMQELQPDIAKLRAEYGKDRQGLAEAMQKLQKDRGVNPLAGCLPLVLQAPVFIALLHVLRRLAPGKPGLYTWTDELTDSAAKATVFGAPISSHFTQSGASLQRLIDATGTTEINIKVVTGILIVVMCITQFLSTRQIMKRSGPVEGQAALIQKLMLYGAPIGLLFSGTFFPLGVLIYWFTNNLWTISQQFWVLKKYPSAQQLAHEEALSKEKAKAALDPGRLAPKPGARPSRTKPIAAAATSAEETADVEQAPLDAPATGSAPATSAAKSAANGTTVKANGRPAGSSAKPGTSPKGAKTVPPAPGAKPTAGTKPATGSKSASAARTPSAGATAAGSPTASSAASRTAPPARRKKR